MGQAGRTALTLFLAKQRNAALRANAEWETYARELEKALEDRPLSLPDLHPLIQQRCIRLFRDGHYEEALSNAVKCVEVRLREASELDNSLYGVQLATAAFSGNPAPLSVSNSDAEQDGCHLLFRGFFAFVRNAVMHRFLDADCPDIYAFERLVLASCLLRIIDAANGP